MTGEEVRLDSEGHAVCGSLFAPEAATGEAVLFVHGLGGSRLDLLDLARLTCLTRRATCLAIDLGGHGRSTGRLTEMTPRTNLADVTSAYDALAGRAEVDPIRISVCAASYGGYLSVLLTASRQVSRLLLRAPALYTDQSFDQPLAKRRYGDPTTAATALRHAALFAGPVTIVESGADEVLGHEIIASYLQAMPRATHVIQPGAGHALTDPA